MKCINYKSDIILFVVPLNKHPRIDCMRPNENVNDDWNWMHGRLANS